MRPFRIALGILTCLKFTGHAPTQNELSRSLAHFPLIGILIATVLVLLDQGMSRWISVFVSNALLLMILTALRSSRGVQDMKIPFNLPFRIIFLILKYFLFWGVPAPLRWISLTFMTTFSSGALTWALRRINPETFGLENILWSSLICFFLGFICGTLGIFVIGVCAALLPLALRFLKNRLESHSEARLDPFRIYEQPASPYPTGTADQLAKGSSLGTGAPPSAKERGRGCMNSTQGCQAMELQWIEEGMEVVVLGAVMVFHYSWKYFWN